MRNENDFFQYIKDIEQRLRVLERNRTTPSGAGIGLDVTNFNRILGAADDNVQHAFDTIDNLLDTQNLVPFMHLGMSGAQTVDNGTVIAFNTVRASNGLTNASNGINLKAGKTYRLMAWVNFSGATGNAYLGYQFYGNGVAFGANAYSNAATSPTAYGFKAPLIWFLTPSVDTLVDVRVVDDSIGTGSVEASWNCSFFAEEILAGVKGEKGDAGDLNIDAVSGALSVNGDVSIPAGKKFKVNGLTVLPRSTKKLDSTSRTFSTTFADGYALGDITIRDGFDAVRLDINIPMRNDSASWGGGYTRILHSVNGGAFGTGLGQSAYEHVMAITSDIIECYVRSFLFTRADLGAPATGDFTVNFKMSHRSYDGTLNVNHGGGQTGQFVSHYIVTEAVTA